MANTTAVYARIDTGLKENAENILSQLGISPSSAIQMLYSQIVLTQGFPLDLRLPQQRPTAIGGMTQAQLGDAIGVSERTIQNWEWGKTSPRPAQVKAIESLLADREPVTIARLVAIIESQQRVIESLTREHCI